MADSPIAENGDIVTIEITSEGSKIKDYYEVKSIRIRNYVNKVPRATLVLFDGNPASQKFEISDASDFEPGKEIEIKLGYGSKNTSVFKGVVVNHGLTIDEDQYPCMEIEIKDKTQKMTIGRKNAYFKEKKDSDVISSLISDAGLSADVSACLLYTSPSPRDA